MIIRLPGHLNTRWGEISWMLSILTVLRYAVTPKFGLLASFQRSERKQSFEHDVVHNTNVSVGSRIYSDDDVGSRSFARSGVGEETMPRVRIGSRKLSLLTVVLFRRPVILSGHVVVS